MIPSGIVYWLSGQQELLACMTAFLWPPALVLDWLGLNAMASLCLSALAQGIAYFALIRCRRLSSKSRLTIAVTWGMFFALLLRLQIAYTLWARLHGR